MIKLATTSILCCVLATGLLSCSKDSQVPESEIKARTLLNLPYGSDPLQKIDVYLPANRNYNTPLIFLIHGGGFYGGDKSDFSSHAQALEKQGFAVVNINYRLVDSTGAKNTPPVRLDSDIKTADQLEDIKTVLKFTDQQASSWIISAAKWAMTGHSAGGTLTLLYSYGPYNSDHRIKVAANWAGVTDFSFPDESYAAAFSPFVLEMLERGVGVPVKNENLPYYKAVSPYWILKEGAAIPTLNIRPELNTLPGTPDVSKLQYAAFGELLNSKNVPNETVEVAGADHSFTKAGNWQLVLDKTAAFFNAQLN